MGKPHALKPGDKISLVSPASFLTTEQTERGIKYLESLGYKVKTYPATYRADGYLAGTDEERADDLTAAFHDSEAQAVYCARGGYGSSRLVPYLDFDALAKSEKLFIGFSDITILHAALNRRGLPTLYGPMAFTFGYDREPWVFESFANTITGGNPIPVDAPKADVVHPGKAEGIVVGGCMCLICDLIGTPDQIDMTNKIVLIEDVDEAPHRVDGSFTHLINAGCLQNAAGIVVGEMTRTNDKMDKSIGSKPWDEIVRERLSHVDVPSVINFPFGHMSNMLSLPLGIQAKLNADHGTMTYVESLCK